MQAWNVIPSHCRQDRKTRKKGQRNGGKRFDQWRQPSLECSPPARIRLEHSGRGMIFEEFGVTHVSTQGV